MPLPPLPAVLNQHQQSAAGEKRPLSWPATAPAIPNLSGWQPGDVLVMKALPTSQPIVAFQKRHPDTKVHAFADWTHCAVYIGDGLMVDTRPSWGARIRRLYPETVQREIAVRRLKSAILSSPPLEREMLGEYSALLEDVPYMSYVNLGLSAYLKRNVGMPLNSGKLPSALVCSSLVEYAADKAGVALRFEPSSVDPILPASLMSHPWLEDVPADWRQPL